MFNTRFVAAAGLAAMLAFPAMAQGHWVPGHWDWSGGRADDRRAYDLDGPGLRILYPELSRTPRGRAFVARNFDWNHDGFITPREARAANRAFAESAGPDHGRFDWAVVDAGPPVAVPVPVREGPPMREREAMRAYHFRDTPEGARMTLQEDVLFRTDSAELRPGAIDKLRALADYLHDNAGVRVAIDGFTDSRGSEAHNQDLSERRAESVRAAFDRMGVTEARFRVRGHGEHDPVATNATAAGMRLNRRVEVTLLGQRASAFGG
ncbi:OmpA family protein [Sphingomonas abietis]|uniref:OmpA family protein n=1 Tax=Sphingomonas abietis TaxID=3012344 RepID=A0ABY7NNC1_9SPHN|nr:OmpA family protein [Sphingomonas abietis]WBO22712.1 OmpA family protein [Sphingomonas abietis]